MKKNNRGFLLAESLVVSTFVLTILILLYIQFSNLTTNYRNSYNYNNVESIYDLSSVSNYLLENNYNLSNQLTEEKPYVVVYKDGSCNMDAGIIDSFCDNLITQMGAKTIIYTSSDISVIQKYVSENNDSNINQSLREFISRVETNTVLNKGRLFAEFNNGTYATIAMNNETYLPGTPSEGSINIGGVEIPAESGNGGIYEDEHGDFRYYGSDPNNYVSFNNELWRIMGVIDGKIKIVRNDALTPVTTDNGVTIGTSNGFYWNRVQQSGKNYNNWEGSTLQTYLNGTYYNSINSTYKNMISEETYYLGGATSSNYQTLTASGYYDAERDSTQVYSGDSNDPNPASTTQHIGLMYPSDYGYAAGESCLSTALNSYNSSCRNTDYLYSGVYEWLQAPYASYSINAAYLDRTGYVYGLGTVVDLNAYAVRPVLYLNSNIQITGGDGSESNPFTLV